MADDENGMYGCIAFDPGGTTGWCVMATFPEVMGPPPFPVWIRNTYEEDPKAFPSGALEAARLAWKQEQANAAGFRLLENIAHYEVGEVTGDEDDQADYLAELIGAWPSSYVVVGESFKLRTFRMDEELLSPVRVMAKVEYAIRRLGLTGRLPRGAKRRVIKQQPALALGSVTDDRLRLWNGGRLFNATRGLPHGRDATRHALTFLRRERDARARGKSLELPIVLPARGAGG